MEHANFDASHSKTRILLVDDEPVARSAISGMLEDQFQVLPTGTGEEAMELLPAFDPDIVILDAVLPGISGWEVCRRIRSLHPDRNRKIIMISAHATNPQKRMEGYQSGADDYIIKPFIHEDLLAKVVVWSRQKQREDALTNRLSQVNNENSQLRNSNSRLQEMIRLRNQELLNQRRFPKGE